MKKKNKQQVNHLQQNKLFNQCLNKKKIIQMIRYWQINSYNQVKKATILKVQEALVVLFDPTSIMKQINLQKVRYQLQVKKKIALKILEIVMLLLFKIMNFMNKKKVKKICIGLLVVKKKILKAYQQVKLLFFNKAKIIIKIITILLKKLP